MRDKCVLGLSAVSDLMTDASATGLQAVIVANRERLLRFIAAHGAGDAAEDILHELWLRVGGVDAGPVSNPLSYLYRAANNLMIDRVRSQRQTVQRERQWSDVIAPDEPERSEAPAADRTLIARETLAGVQRMIDDLGVRAATAFRRHRVDGVAQRDIARELGVSLSTVEADLRRAYRALIDYRRSLDEV